MANPIYFRVLVVCLLCIFNIHGFITGNRLLSSRRSKTFASTIGREIVSYPKELAPIEINNHIKLLELQDCDFFDCVLDSEGLSIVIFSRYQHQITFARLPLSTLPLITLLDIPFFFSVIGVDHAKPWKQIWQNFP